MAINVLLALMIIVSFLVAVALHEFGHALVAYWLGDTTPLTEGRFTLRIPAHIDPVGLLMCVILAFQPIGTPPVGIGWGKPVKPDPWKMRVGANAGVLIVAWAGPVFSLAIGLLAALVASLTSAFLVNNIFTQRILQLLIVFACVNISVTLFNLIPLYPLDGYQILYALLPSRQAVQYSRSAPYGPFIILALFFVLPFVARLAGVEAFPLFRLAFYIWYGAANLVALFFGPYPGSFQFLYQMYVL